MGDTSRRDGMVVVRVISSHTNKTKVVNLRGYPANLRNANLEGFSWKGFNHERFRTDRVLSESKLS